MIYRGGVKVRYGHNEQGVLMTLCRTFFATPVKCSVNIDEDLIGKQDKKDN